MLIKLYFIEEYVNEMPYVSRLKPSVLFHIKDQLCCVSMILIKGLRASGKRQSNTCLILTKSDFK